MKRTFNENEHGDWRRCDDHATKVRSYTTTTVFVLLETYKLYFIFVEWLCALAISSTMINYVSHEENNYGKKIENDRRIIIIKTKR